MGKPRTHGLYVARVKACAHCKAPFVARTPLARFCSNACREAGTRYGRMTYGQKASR